MECEKVPLDVEGASCSRGLGGKAGRLGLMGNIWRAELGSHSPPGPSFAATESQTFLAVSRSEANAARRESCASPAELR